MPGLVVAEVDYSLRDEPKAMRKLLAEIFDPATRHEYELPPAADFARALALDAGFDGLSLGLVGGTVAAERRRIFRFLTICPREFGAILESLPATPRLPGLRQCFLQSIVMK